jgi:catechol 2,3-dioxygenase-like lactoylglutathione lyase family enzyme
MAKTYTLKSSLAVAAGFLALALPAVAAQKAPAGFTALFNGKDLSGWYGWGTRDPSELWAMSPEQQAAYKKQSIAGGLTDKKGKAVADHINAHWSVQGDELVNDGKGLYLTTAKDYGDFELLLEYKALPKGDSGVYLRGVPQVQIWDATVGDPRGLGQDKGSGGLFNNIKGSPGKDPSQKMDKPFGEWNSFKITMIGERVTVVFNGVKVVDHAVMENYFANQKSGYVAFAAPAAKGKGKDGKEAPPPPAGHMRDPIFARGPIQLQTHGSEIRWRNVFVREISPEEATRTLAARDAQGFVELVNGKDLSNWTGAVENYEVRSGAIYCKPGKGGNLLSQQEYGDMIIRTEFILPKGGNNGIAIRTPANGRPAQDGFELQVIDSDGYNAAHPKAPLKPYQYHGSLYNLIGAKHGYLRPVGEWNYEEIVVRGNHITVTLNGTKILDVETDKIDRSKFNPKTLPKGLDRTSGHIGFAGHNDPVGFRSFKVKKL